MAAKRAVFDAASSGGVGELTLKSRLPNIGLLSKRLELLCIIALDFLCRPNIRFVTWTRRSELIFVLYSQASRIRTLALKYVAAVIFLSEA